MSSVDGVTFGDVRLEDVPAFWPLVEGFIAAACDYADGDTDIEHERDGVHAGDKRLWVAHDGVSVLAAVTTEILDMPRQRICLILMAGGHPQVPWSWVAAQIEEYAAAQGCSRSRVIGRRGWERKLPDYRIVAVIFSKELTNGQR